MSTIVGTSILEAGVVVIISATLIAAAIVSLVLFPPAVVLPVTTGILWIFGPESISRKIQGGAIGALALGMVLFRLF